MRTADLLAEPVIVMRSGYVMHRYLHRLLQGQPPAFSYSTDGAEMGKLMVAEGLGLTVLPDFSVIGDPLEQHGVITWRPLADDHTGVDLVIQRARSGSPPLAARDLHDIFVERARRPHRQLHGRDHGSAARTGTVQGTRPTPGEDPRSVMISGLPPMVAGPWPPTHSDAAAVASRTASGTGWPRNISVVSVAAKQSPAPVGSTRTRTGSAVYSVDPSRVRTSQPRRPRVTTPRPPWRGTAASSSLT